MTNFLLSARYFCYRLQKEDQGAIEAGVRKRSMEIAQK